jgi:hypothetical protein
MAVTPDPHEYTDEERREEESLERQWRRGAVAIIVTFAAIVGGLIALVFVLSQK